MYIPTHFKEDRIEVLHGLIAAHSLGTHHESHERCYIANSIKADVVVESA